MYIEAFGSGVIFWPHWEIVEQRWRLSFKFKNLNHLIAYSVILYVDRNKEVFDKPVICRFLKDEYFNVLTNYDINGMDFYSPLGDKDERFCIRKYGVRILLSGFILKKSGKKFKEIDLLLSKEEFKEVQNKLEEFKNKEDVIKWKN